MIDGDVAQDAGESRRIFFPWEPAVAEIDRRHAGIAQQRCHRVQVMMSVNDIWCDRQSVEIIDNRNCRGSNFLSDVPQLRAIGDGHMSAFEQSDCQIAHVEFGTATKGQRVVCD